MKYLFFDIECSNCFNGIGKMCEFGYVLTDEELNVIKSGDIPMSPGKGDGNRFHLKGRKHEKDLELAYEYDFYYAQPEFKFFYSQIKRMVEDPDTICFAYSMDNDIPHLHNACKRYKLKPFNYTCYDVQKLVSVCLERKGQTALKKACLEIVGPNSVVRLQEHLSRDDAMMEKLIFEAICIFEKKSSRELLELSNYAKTNSIEYMNRLKDRVKRKRLKTAGHALYNSLALSDEELDKEEYLGKRYNVSGDLKADLNALKVVINLVKERNGIFCNKISKSDYFIAYDAKNKEEIINGFKHPFDGKVITYQEFLESINK